MSEIVKDPSAPESIWLQTGGAYSVTRGSDDLTWSDEEIDDTDEKYVRADIAATLRTRAEAAELNAAAGAVRQADELAAMRGVVDAAWRVDACEDPEAEETAHAFDDLRKRLVALDALTKTEG